MADHQTQPLRGPYQPKDAIGIMTYNGLISAGFGAFIAGLQNTLTKQNYGATGFITKFGSTTALFAGSGAVYGFSQAVAANLREEDDATAAAIGGFFGGAVLGLKTRSLPAMIGFGTGLAVIQFTYSYTGGRLNGYKSSQDDEKRFQDRQWLQENRRRSIYETISEVGEGRGVYGPGYEERRRQKIKENYGIDITLPEKA